MYITYCDSYHTDYNSCMSWKTDSKLKAARKKKITYVHSDSVTDQYRCYYVQPHHKYKTVLLVRRQRDWFRQY